MAITEVSAIALIVSLILINTSVGSLVVTHALFIIKQYPVTSIVGAYLRILHHKDSINHHCYRIIGDIYHAESRTWAAAVIGLLDANT
tara:strand:+ start:2009 stop:2272 length:264 start_codon:yes stop_codon:yes gene_type:complete